jgi:thioredoxin-related protein
MDNGDIWEYNGKIPSKEWVKYLKFVAEEAKEQRSIPLEDICQWDRNQQGP